MDAVENAGKKMIADTKAFTDVVSGVKNSGTKPFVAAVSGVKNSGKTTFFGEIGGGTEKERVSGGYYKA